MSGNILTPERRGALPAMRPTDRPARPAAVSPGGGTVSVFTQIDGASITQSGGHFPGALVAGRLVRAAWRGRLPRLP